MPLTATQLALVSDYVAALRASRQEQPKPCDVAEREFDFVDPMSDEELEDYEEYAEEMRTIVSDEDYYAARESHLDYLRAIGALSDTTTAA